MPNFKRCVTNGISHEAVPGRLRRHLFDRITTGARPANPSAGCGSSEIKPATSLIAPVVSGMQGIKLKTKNAELLNCYDRFFRLPGLEIVELDAAVIDIATELRANHPGVLRTPDAIQVACAITYGADQFLTGDKKLAAVQEIKVIVV